MLLKKLELSGFKSFARKTEFEFATRTTAIVGPNGSGKSNIAESIRFVLGEQSMKSLRSKRGEDLIWNGTPGTPKLNRADVAITFDNTKRLLNVDYDEVEIRRTIYRDSASQYLINGSPVRLKDVFELLSGIHIGASSHHIISQGQADHILSASIKERRGMVEDALGLKVYQYKRLESERKLAKTRENIGQVEALRKEIAPHLKFLQKQMEKVEQAEKLREELKMLYREYLAREEMYLEHHNKRLQEKRGEPQQELHDLEKRIKNNEIKLQELTKGRGAHADLEVLDTTLRKLREEKDTHSRRIGRLEGMLSYAKKEQGGKKIGDTVSFNRNAVDAFIQKLESAVETALALNEVDGLKEALRSLRTSISHFWQKEVKGKEELQDYKTLEKELKTTEEAFKELSSEEAKIQEERARKARTLEEERGDERKFEHELFALRSRRSELLTRLELLRVDEEKLRGEAASLKETLREVGLWLGRDAISFDKTAYAFTPDEPRAKQEERKWKIERIKIKIEDIGGGDDIKKEYEEVASREEYLSRELLDLEKSADALAGLIEELSKKIDAEFKDGIQKINKEFQRLFVLMFGGGTAALKIVAPPPKKKKRLLDELESADVQSEEIPGDEVEEEEGVEITINLPSKKIRGLQALSGGERSLTSIALIFAITNVNPPPFLLLDETDAALDESNSRKFGNMIHELSEKTQFIIITHNRETMTRAGVLYGITSGSEGVSRVLSVKLEEAVGIAQ
ncbi:MAG: AAA family ATPase [Parcubacteria group bacterium]|nr:AAA family ATPase [Parcubacteria group bacterium]